jgi:HK97 family phage portal protein
MFEKVKDFFSKEIEGDGAKEGAKIEEGKVYIVTTKDIFPFSELKKYEFKKSSKQLEEKETKWLTVGNLLSKLYSPSSFIRLYEHQPVLMAAINQISEDISGTGWKLVLRPEQEEDSEEKKVIEKFLNNVNPKQSIKELLYCCFVDYLLLGGLNIEVSRFFNGRIAELFHVPEKTLYVHKSLKRFSQYYVGKSAWFVPYDPDPEERLNIHAETGVKGKWDFETQGHELIRHINYNPRSSFYGLAPLTSAISSILNLIESSQFHLSFLTSRGIPEYMISLSGKWEEGAAKKITNFIRTEMQGEHFKSMVLNLPEAGSVKFDKLAVDIKSSEFLLELSNIAREDILSVYRIPPSRLCLFKKGGSLSSNIYSEANRTYWESVVLPSQMIAEKIVNKILEGVLGQESRYHFEILDLDLRTETEDITNYVKLFSMGSMTPNQIRGALGKETYEGGDKYYINRNFVPVEETQLKARNLKKEATRIEEEEQRFIDAMVGLRNDAGEVLLKREEM